MPERVVIIPEPTKTCRQCIFGFGREGMIPITSTFLPLSGTSCTLHFYWHQRPYCFLRDGPLFYSWWLVFICGKGSMLCRHYCELWEGRRILQFCWCRLCISSELLCHGPMLWPLFFRTSVKQLLSLFAELFNFGGFDTILFAWTLHAR